MWLCQTEVGLQTSKRLTLGCYENWPLFVCRAVARLLISRGTTNWVLLKQRGATLSVLKARSPKLRCVSENSS